MKKKKFNKKNVIKNKYKIILLSFFIILSITSFFYYSDQKSDFVRNTKELVPQKYKQFLKNTIFSISELKIRNSNLEKDLKDLKKRIWNNEADTIEIFSQLKGIDVQNENIEIIKKKIPFESTISSGYGGKPLAYLDKINDKIIFVSGTGTIKFGYSKNIALDSKIKLFEIKNNLLEIIKDDAFWDDTRSVIVKDSRGHYKNLSNVISVKGIMINDGLMYISYVKEIKENCYATSVLYAKFDKDNLQFKELFSPKDCVSAVALEFLGHSAGGRMTPYTENQILLTVGEFSQFDLVQNDSNEFGKILAIDIRNGNYETISKGHRNAQGLIYLNQEDVILSTEHGPKGGDEINKIVKGGNYGWPDASYGIINSDELKAIGPKFNKHKENGFNEPTHYWDINPGIGQIIKVPLKFSNNWNNRFLITSLSGSEKPNGRYMGKSLFLTKFNQEFTDVVEMDRIFIGERMRDIIYDDEFNLFLITMESSSNIGLLRIKKD